MLRPVIACLLAGAFPCAANAAILNADPTNLLSVFARAQGGDTIKVTGTFGSIALQNRNFASRVTIDATGAVFADTLTIQNVTGLTMLRGTYGSRTAPMRSARAVAVNTSVGVKFQNGIFIGNAALGGSTASLGLTVTSSDTVQVSAGNFSNFRVGLGVLSSTNVKIDSSKFVAMSSDGINIADSRFVTATANTCTGTVAFAGAHPDCIQMWSILGRPVQSDIVLQRNIARDATQGFASFNPEDGGALRVTMIGNTVATSYPQGIACYNCRDSVFKDNVLSTLPGSQYQTSVNIVGGGNNIVANNSIAPYLAWPAQLRMEDNLSTYAADPLGRSIDEILAEDYALLQGGYLDEESAFLDEAGSMMMSDGFESLAEAVPEPGIWAQLILGFGLVGALARRRMRVVA